MREYASGNTQEVLVKLDRMLSSQSDSRCHMELYEICLEYY